MSSIKMTDNSNTKSPQNWKATETEGRIWKQVTRINKHRGEVTQNMETEN